MKKNKFAICFLVLVLAIQNNLLAQTPFVIADDNSNPSVTTHEISSGGVILGITDKGGGMINKFALPGYGDLMGPTSDRYGRGGQTAIRSHLHGGRYNPTQAGFTDSAGTQCPVTKSPGKLVVERRPCSLYNGDGVYDFTEWENLASDYYSDGGVSDRNSDTDGIDETNLSGKQAEEITSEFDFYSVYEDYKGKKGVEIPCFYNYYEFTFARFPGHCLEQFGEGTPIYTPVNKVADISVKNPAGVHAATDLDMSKMTHWSTIRLDNDRFPAKYRHYVNMNGNWVTELRAPQGVDPSLEVNMDIHLAGATVFPMLIISDYPDINQGPAIGVFQPNSENVGQQIIGGGNSAAYTDDRRFLAWIQDVPLRSNNMQKFGFGGRINGMLNRNRTPNNEPETWRGEMFYLVGTPAEIFTNALKINADYATKTIASAPSNLQLNSSIVNCNAQVAVSWSANNSSENVTLYEIWRSDSLDGTYYLIASTIDTLFVDDLKTSLNTTYFYKIRALNLGGFSNFSSIDSITVPSFSISCKIPSVVVGWDFDSSDEGWNSNRKNVNISWNYMGYLGCSPTGIDPYVYNVTPPTFSTNNVNYLEVRVKNETANTAGTIYVWTTTVGTLAIPVNMLANSTEFQTIIVDLSTITNWSNNLNITNVRLDPNNGGQPGLVSYDHIYFVNNYILNGSLSSNAEEFQTESLIYPNPINIGENIFVTIRPQKSMSSTRITINDLSGKLIYTKETTNEKLISISTSRLTTGIYLMYIESLEAKKVFKFIVR